MHKQRRMRLAAAAAVVAAISATAMANDWIVTNGNFNTPGNWSPGVPGSADTAVFGVTGGHSPNYTVTFTNNPTNAQLQATAVPTFDLAGHTYTVGAASATAVQLSQGAVLTVGSSTQTGTLNATGTIIVGGVGGIINSTLTFEQGTQLAGSSALQIGNDGGGTFNVISGATASTAGTTIGSIDASYSGSGATGSATVSGAGSAWTDSNSITVGSSAAGSLAINSGASVTDEAGLIGQGVSAPGTVTVDGAGSAWHNTFDLSVGSSSSASLSITNGALVTAGGEGQIGSFGSISVSGTGSQLTGLGNYVISTSTTLSNFTALSISSGGKVTGGAGNISNAAVSINNGKWTNTGDMNLVSSSVTLSAGGTLSTADAFGQNGQQQIAVTGASSKWTTGSFYIDGSVNVKSGGAVAASDIIFGGDHDSAVTIDGANSTLASTGLMRIVGGTSTGTTFTVSNGASVTNGSVILNEGGGPLVATLQDSTSSWATTGDFSLTPGSVTLNVSGGTFSAGSLTFDTGTPAPTVNFSGGTMNIGSLALIGETANFKWTVGTFNLTASDLVIGPTGGLGQSLNLSAGKILQVSGTGHNLTIDGMGNGGFVTLSGGSASVNSTLTIGSTAIGGLVLEGASSLSDDSVSVAALTNGFGSVNVGPNVGDNPTWTTTNSFYVGGNAAGAGGKFSFNIKRGSVSAGGTLLVYAGSSTLNLSGGSLTVGAISVARGQFIFTGGTLDVTNSDFTVGTTGTPSISGTVFELPTGTTLDVTGASNKFALQSGAELLLDGGTLSAKAIDLTLGSTKFLNGTMNIDTGVLSAGGIGNFSFGGNVTGTGSLTKSGGGTMTLSVADSYSGGTTVTGGTLALSTNGALPNNKALTINASATVSATAHGAGPTTLLQLSSLTLDGTTNAWTAKLDLNNNDAIIHNGNLANIRNQIKQGYAAGAWNGQGITSSSAAAATAPKTALGYGTITGVFDNQVVTNTDVVVKYTLVGDTNLDGSVNFTDLLALAQNYNKTNTTWQTGDFNYDGATNFTDLLGLAQNYNKTLSLSATQISELDSAGDPSFAAAFAQAEAQVAVPEPGAGIFVLAGATLMCRRRRFTPLITASLKA